MSTHPSIESVVAAVQRRWGAKALRRLEQMTAHTTGIPTGHAALDRLVGQDGVPRGMVTCLSGRSTSGKTTLALDTLAQVQADDEVTVYIDMTGTLDPEYAEQRGIDLERLLIVCPQPPVLGLDIARDIVTSGGAGLIVVDGGGWGSLAEPAGPTLRQFSAIVRRSAYAMLCLTVTHSTGWTAALVARADLHLLVERGRWLWDAEGVSGYETRLTILKNRFGPPGQSVILPIMLGERRAGP